MMKKAALVTTVFLMICLSLGMALAQENAGQTSVQELLNQMSMVLDSANGRLTLKLSVYDALAQVIERNDYASLMDARIVCDSAVRESIQLETPTNILSNEALKELIGRDVDTEGVEFEIYKAENEIYECTGAIQEADAWLYNEIYCKSGREKISRHLTLEDSMIRLEKDYMILWVNYTLAPLWDDADVQLFWENLPSRWPGLCETTPEWEADIKTLEDRVTENSAEEAMLNDEADLIGDSEYAFYVYQNALENNKVDALKEDVNRIEGMPIMFPYPTDWPYEDETTLMRIELGEGGSESALWMVEVASGGEELYESSKADLKAYLEDYFDESFFEVVSENGRKSASLVIDGTPIAMIICDPAGQVSIGYRPDFLSMEEGLYIDCYYDE